MTIAFEMFFHIEPFHTKKFRMHEFKKGSILVLAYLPFQLLLLEVV